MKKLLVFVVIIMFTCSWLSAGPVDVNTAQIMGRKFVQANFRQDRSNDNMELVYTVISESGDLCLYVFNVSDNGFIIISASDCVRPILGYSEESTFDVDNIAPGLNYYLGVYKASISYAIDNLEVAENWVASEWDNLEKYGKPIVSRDSKSVAPLCSTKWDQPYPYNIYCPETSASYGSGGHVVVGCVATAMAMIMAYWDYPVQGTGSHTYIDPPYGEQSANFGETTYDWANMPDMLNSNSTQTEIDAVAILSYHCGVAVEMNYATDPSGSGANSEDVSDAMSNYFSYAPNSLLSRSLYSLDTWNSMLKESIDCGCPVYYSGQSTDGGHAFICDGYKENDLFHFNFGWSGSGNGYFAVDAIDFNTLQGAIMNIKPLEVYNNTAQAPANFTVIPTADDALSATISWTNPSKTLNDTDLTSIDQIVVTRDGEVIYVGENPVPGATVTITDDNVPCFDIYDYSIYAISNEIHGAFAYSKGISFGPTCSWKILMTSNSIQGWEDGYISLVNTSNNVVATLTTTTASASIVNFDAPLGIIKFAWTEGSKVVSNMTFNIKNSSNESVYSFSGSSTNLEEGVFVTINNNCGNNEVCECPGNLYTSSTESSITLNWDGVNDKGYGYNIYRDGVLYKLVQENTFTDDNLAVGGYCYFIRVLCDGGESEATNESCTTIGEGCNAPKNIWYEYTASFKPKITWENPDTEGLSGYYIFRRVDGETEWKRVKLVNSSTTSFSDNSSLVDGTWYQYKVQAYYQDLDCLSAPANNRYNNMEFMVRVYYSITNVEENAAEKASIYPNPTSNKLNIKAEGMNNISIFNMTGQKVMEVNVNAEETELDINNLESGVYMVRIAGDDFEVTKRISVIK